MGKILGHDEDGEVVRVGDYVCFKDSVEKCGRAVGRRAHMFTIEERVNGQVIKHSISMDKCWKE